MTTTDGRIMAERSEPAIVTGNLSKTYGKTLAVDRLSIEVPEGSIFGLLGPNGAGKSTIIKMLTTILPPTGGSAFVAGHSIIGDPVGVRRSMGYVSQMLSADGALTGYENLLLFARIYGIPGKEKRRRIDDALAFMGLSDVSKKLVGSYSGGMIRRLEIAQTILHHPSVVFLDEPTIGLDPVARRHVWEKLRELRASYRTTILLTTHDMEEADELCDLIAILQSGRIVVTGSPEELKRQAGTDSMDEVFIHFAGGDGAGDQTATYREIIQTRRTAQRLG
jgi:ABC-2 type transport system ATP-binding protein